MFRIDSDRVDFNDLNIKTEAERLGLLAPLKDVPSQNSADYKGMPVDVNCPENQEPLVDVRDYGVKSVSYYRTQAKRNPTYNTNISGAPEINWAREGTAQRLQEANAILDKLGLELVVVDGHRSPTTQNILFRAFKEKFFEKIGCAETQRTEDNSAIIDKKRRFYDLQAIDYAHEFCSSAENFDARDSKTWTIHSTGGAMDVYMLDKKSGRVVDMGEGYFDNPIPETNTAFYENKDDHELTTKEKGYKFARRILYNVMTQVGFVNYGYECFHYSYKDPYWACVKGETARYGYVPNPRDRGLSLMIGALVEKGQEKN